ncbi:MAG: hypothetical protein O9284_15390 [Steroidobacteraceae bacterium]|nr:hypothetical protein [Steroidobacteraceae bacterium]
MPKDPWNTAGKATPALDRLLEVAQRPAASKASSQVLPAHSSRPATLEPACSS